MGVTNWCHLMCSSYRSLALAAPLDRLRLTTLESSDLGFLGMNPIALLPDPFRRRVVDWSAAQDQNFRGWDFAPCLQRRFEC